MSVNLNTLEHMATWKALAVGLREEVLLHAAKRTPEAERLLAAFDEVWQEDPETVEEFRERHAVMWSDE